MKQIYALCLLSLISLNVLAQLQVPDELQSYYGETVTDDSERLEDFLKTLSIEKHTTKLSYGQRHNFLYTADANPNNASEVILMYSGEIRDEREYQSSNNTYNPQTFNTEHVFVRSRLSSSIKDVAEADLHHLRSCDIQVNNNRDNNPFANNAADAGFEDLGNAWFPGAEWKGDVARMIMYVNLRYDEPFTDVGTLDLFLEWNAEDPVSDFEINRNEVISGAQGVRNPFIDNPFLATVIWGGADAEDRWESLSVISQDANSIKMFPNPSTGNYVNILSNKAIAVEVFDILGKKVSTQNISENQKKLNVAGLKSGVYLVKLKTESSSETRKLIIR